MEAAVDKAGVVHPANRRRRPFLFADEIFIDGESWLKMGAPASLMGRLAPVLWSATGTGRGEKFLWGEG
ncbi:MAG: hypothetical protein IJ668_09380 [Selenomonadaceae bacterium]|nr:hypothetical protein [Selenomonadaceae bacterium]